MAVEAPSSATLCTRCAEIDFSFNWSEAWNPEDPHKTAVRLGRYFEIAKDPECPCCKLLDLLVARNVHPIEREGRPSTLPDFLDQTFYLRPFAFKPSDGGPTLSTSDGPPSLNIVEDWVLREHPQYHIDESITLWANLGYLKPASPVNRDLTFDPDQPQPLANLRLSRSWLEHCRLEHVGDCDSSHSHWIPNFRLIDCRSLTVINASSETVYVALSYVWGRIAEDSVADALYTLPTQLPATIQDAIHVTKELGYSYLWVDRYCIPQHDGEERQKQISQMGHIYTNADLTIVAAASSDSAHGLPGVGLVREKLGSMNIACTRYVLTPPDSSRQVQVSK